MHPPQSKKKYCLHEGQRNNKITCNIAVCGANLHVTYIVFPDWSNLFKNSGDWLCLVISYTTRQWACESKDKEGDKYVVFAELHITL